MEKLNGSDNTGTKDSTVYESESFLVLDQDRSSIQEFGQYLRRERELRKISLEEIAKITRINLRYLVAIEEGREEELPAEPFIKGFLAAYAKHIGLNPEDVLTYFKEIREEHTSADKEHPVSPAQSRTKLFILSLLIIIAAAVIYFIYAATRSKVNDANEQGAAVGNISGFSEPSRPWMDYLEHDWGLKKDGMEGIQKYSGEDASYSPINSGIELSLKATEKTWAYAIIDEKEVKEFFLQPGEKMDLTARRVVSLTLGNAGGVNITFNGNDLGKLGKPNEVKRDLLFKWDQQRGSGKIDSYTRREDAEN